MSGRRSGGERYRRSVDDPQTGVVALQRAATHFGLGTIRGLAEARHGGVNRLWRVPTDRGVFAVHELLGIPEGVDPVERCQRVYDLEMAAAAAGVSIASPIPGPDSACALLPGMAGPVVVHRWVDALPVHVERTDSSLFERLGWSLAHIHSLDADPARVEVDALERRPTAEEWAALAEQADRVGWPWAPHTAQAAGELAEGIRIVDEWDRAANENPVRSHRDLTSANVLDDHGEPVLIDWEDAGPIGPGNEIGRTALDNLGWRGHLDPDALGVYLRGYRRVARLPAVGPHWCSLWVRGLIVYAEHCARSCLTATAPPSLLAHQSKVVATAPAELRRRVALVDSLLAAFENALPATSSKNSGPRPQDQSTSPEA